MRQDPPPVTLTRTEVSTMGRPPWAAFSIAFILALAAQVGFADPLTGPGPKFEKGKKADGPAIVGKAMGASGGGGGLPPVGELASVAYHDALLQRVREGLLSTKIIGDDNPCKRLAAILYFINEKVSYVDADTGQPKEAPAFRMDKDTLGKTIDKMVPNVEIFFVDLPFRGGCLGTPGVAVAAGITREAKAKFSAASAGDCRRSVGDPKKDAILVFNVGGKEKDAAGGTSRPWTVLGSRPPMNSSTFCCPSSRPRTPRSIMA